MSTPQQQSQPHSRTPSKSSLRRTSGPQNPPQRNLVPHPSPRFEDNATTEVRYSPRSPPNQTLDYDSNEDDDDDEAAQDALIRRDFEPQHQLQHHEGSYFPIPPATETLPLFEPLFTLVEDNVTSEHHHPSIYYIFADDDHEIITEAALRSLEDDELGGSSSASASVATQAKAQDIGTAEQTSVPPPQPGIREHYLILDLRPNDGTQTIQSDVQSQLRSLSQGPPGGDDSSSQQANFQSQSNAQPTPFVVSSFTSLSPDWQIQSATVTSAPTMSEATSGEDEGFMLRIEGRGFPGLGSSDVIATRARKASNAGPGGPDVSEFASGKEREHETVEEMIDRFQNNLNDIRKLIEIDLPVPVSRSSFEPGVVDEDDGDDDATAGHHQSFDFEAQD